MNLTISKEQIINGLQAVQNVVSTRTTLPILSNVLLRAEGNRLEFTATDLDVTIASAVEAKVEKAGATTVPVKKLFGIVRELGNPEIEIEVDEKHVCTIRSGSSFYKIHGLNADEFPPLPVFKEDKKIVLPQEKLKGMMKKTSFAISTDESRYVLNGIFISLKDHKMTMVATDGRRLALVDEEVDVTGMSRKVATANSSCPPKPSPNSTACWLTRAKSRSAMPRTRLPLPSRMTRAAPSLS